MLLARLAVHSGPVKHLSGPASVLGFVVTAACSDLQLWSLLAPALK